MIKPIQTIKKTLQYITTFVFIYTNKDVIFFDLKTGTLKKVLVGEEIYKQYDIFIQNFTYKDVLLLSRRSFYVFLMRFLSIFGFTVSKEKGNAGIEFAILKESSMLKIDCSIEKQENPYKELSGTTLNSYDFSESMQNSVKNSLLIDQKTGFSHNLPLEPFTILMSKINNVKAAQLEENNITVLHELAKDLCIDEALTIEFLELLDNFLKSQSDERWDSLYDSLLAKLLIKT